MLLPEKKTIAISGASGFIGNALCVFFSSRGYRVKALARKIPSLNMNSDISYQKYKLSDVLNANDFQNVDYFIHCAYSRKKEAIDDMEINQFSCEQIAQLNKAHPFKKIIYFSSIQSSPCSPSFYGRMKFSTEKIFDLKNAVVVRPGMVVGSGGVFGKISKIVNRLPVIPVINKGGQPIYFISLNDLLAVVENILLSESSGIRTLAYARPVMFRELIRILHGKHSPVLINIPRWMLRFFVNVLAIVSFGSSSLSDQTANLFQDLSDIESRDLSVYNISEKKLEEAIADARSNDHSRGFAAE